MAGARDELPGLAAKFVAYAQNPRCFYIFGTSYNRVVVPVTLEGCRSCSPRIASITSSIPTTH
jgi:hypothetical protein